MIRPKRSTLKSRAEVDLRISHTFRNSGKTWSGIPVMAANMDKTGTFSMAREFAKHLLPVALHKHYRMEEWQGFAENAADEVWNSLIVSCGTSSEDSRKLRQLFDAFPSIRGFCIDVANGYSENFLAFVRKARELYPDKILIAGNIATGEMAEELILSGADVVKVGIGPGSVCTTRLKTGVGYPQLSAIVECADAVHGLRGHIVADGGCTCPGDVSKAFGAGADFVMLGGMLAGHDESEGEIIERDGKKFCEFYGMSSATAMGNYAGGVAEYRASEGKSTLVAYKGPVEDTIKDILGGLRSTCTYVGASRLKELSKRTTFIRVAEQENRIFN